MKKLIASMLVLGLVLCLFGCDIKQQESNTQEPNTKQGNALNNSGSPSAEITSIYTYDELSKMPAKELLELFIQNGLVINDDLKATYTEEELQTLFKENFDLWHTGVSAHSHTMYIDLAEQTKEVYEKIVEPQN